jgi:hypothetical protein
LISIFGKRLVDAYWSMDKQAETNQPIIFFIKCFEYERYWMLDLLQLLATNADYNVTELTILWLRWFKHGVAFNGLYLHPIGQDSIPAVKAIINLLRQQNYEDAAQMLILNVASFRLV